MPHVIQLLLPLYTSEQPTVPANDLHAMVKAELTRHFGRCNAHTRSPAGGRWLEGPLGMGDEIVIYEVMSHLVDAQWWDWYCRALEARFHQREVHIRALSPINW